MLQWLCTADVAVPIGRTVYTGVLNARGTYEADVTVTRIDHDAYLRNVHERKFVPPRLHGHDAAGNEVPIKANPDAYRFCFVEKNRIEDFARMSAKTPAQRTELIARLFGMQGFSDFIGNFNAATGLSLPLLRRLHGPTDARQQQRLARFVDHVRSIIAGAAVYAQAYRYAGVEHAANWCDAAGQPHIAARAVRASCSALRPDKLPEQRGIHPSPARSR